MMQRATHRKLIAAARVCNEARRSVALRARSYNNRYEIIRQLFLAR